MPDIAMCKKEECKLKKTCYRYLAEPNKYWQTYICPDKSGADCNYYWKTTKQKKK